MKKKNPNDYTVIPAKCCRTKELFGIRGVRQDGTWHLTWAFKMTASQAKGEHIENNTLSGYHVFDSTYPKCPYCGQDSILLCPQCGHISCASAASSGTILTCAWCGLTAKAIRTNDLTGIKGGGF